MKPFDLKKLVPTIEQSVTLLARPVAVGLDTGAGCSVCLGTTLCGTCAGTNSACEECGGSGGCQNCTPFGPPQNEFPDAVIGLDDGAVQLRQEQRPADDRPEALEGWHFVVEEYVGSHGDMREVLATRDWMAAVQTAVAAVLQRQVAQALDSLDPFGEMAALARASRQR